MEQLKAASDNYVADHTGITNIFKTGGSDGKMRLNNARKTSRILGEKIESMKG